MTDKNDTREKFNMRSFLNKSISLKLIEITLYEVIFFVSYYVALRLDLFSGYEARNYVAFYRTIPFVMLLAGAFIVFIGMLRTVNKTKYENVILIITTVITINTIYMAIAFLGREFAIPRTVLLLGAIIQFALFIIVKFLLIALIKSIKPQRDIILLCRADYKETLVVKVLESHVYKERLTYCIDPFKCVEYMDYVANCDKVYIADNLDGEFKSKVVSYCISRNKSLYMVPKTFEIAVFNSNLIQLSDLPVFKVDSLVLSEEKVLAKNIIDFLFSSIGLVILSPFMLIVALILLIAQGRPILYTQERVTKDNKIFKLYKFRTMYNDAEVVTGPVWASKDDPRVTKVGKFLRRYWIDELPQLINVVKGDMSLVGPRPERPVFIEEFSKEIPDFRYRLSVKAGVTGLAQVLGRYATTPDLKIKYDLLYIKKAGVVFDFKIILETVKKIIIGTLTRDKTKQFDYKSALAQEGYCEEVKDGITYYKKCEMESQDSES